MPYLVREDGTHFIIPAYRDILDGKNVNALKAEVLSLSQRYGEYIALQKKSRFQYELACSSDSGYLLGESIWHALKKPANLVYCEAEANGADAILVIVKAGSVYLDGRFALDDLLDELVMLQTEQLQFEVVIYGHVPLSKKPQDGYFSLSETQISSFRELDQPIFPTVLLYKSYHLQLVEPTLKAHGIGTFPVTRVMAAVVALGLCWMLWTFISTRPPEKEEIPVNPYQGYLTTLHSPDLLSVVQASLDQVAFFSSMPGWNAQAMSYSNRSLKVKVVSYGGSMTDLLLWAEQKKLKLTVTTQDISFTLPLTLPNRPDYLMMYPLTQVIAKVVDTFGMLQQKNLVQLTENLSMGSYNQVKASVQLDDVNQPILMFIGRSLHNLPVEVKSIEWQLQENGSGFSCSLVLNILGN